MRALDPISLRHWRSDPEGFIQTVLYDPETAQPFKLFAAEKQFLDRAFQLDENGRWLYPEMVYGAIRKSAKTGFAALIGLTALLLFGGRFAEVIVCANDLEQAQSRVFQAIRRIVEASPLLKREAKITQDKITFPSFFDATVLAIASGAAGAAGSNPTLIIFDELWGATTERQVRFFEEMVPSPARQFSARLVVSYAGYSGESISLENLYKRGMALPLVGPSLHAAPGFLFAWHTEPIAPWQTPEWVEQMRQSLRPAQFARTI